MKPICATCGREMSLINDCAYLKINHDTYRSCELFECPDCHGKIMISFGGPFYSNDPFDKLPDSVILTK